MDAIRELRRSINVVGVVVPAAAAVAAGMCGVVCVAGVAVAVHARV